MKSVETVKPSSTEKMERAHGHNKRGIEAARETKEKELRKERAKDAAAVERSLDVVGERLAAITIDDTPVREQEKRNQSERRGDPVVNTSPLGKKKKKPVKKSTHKGEPTRSEAHYETMVEVRIPRKDVTEGDHQNQEQRQLKEQSRQTRNKTTKPKPASRHSSGCVHDERATAYIQPILNEALSPVSSRGIQKFSSWASRAGDMFEVVKIAEGSYGEVYKLRFRPELCKQTFSKSKLARLQSYGEGVFKIVPLRAQRGPGSKKFTSIEEIVSEVKMLKYLDPIPGFARFREIHVVQGRFPESFQNAWVHYKQTRPADDCLNPNPASKKAYPDGQLWAILEMDDAGCELEKFSWGSVFQIYDIFWGVAMALARAEEYAMFEHRDLHLGNVCIRTTRSDGSMAPPMDLEIASRAYSSGFGLSRLETTIIDYSLSRADLRVDDDTVEIAYSDLDKKDIFGAIGRDEDEILLRNTYRYMRAGVYKGKPLDTEPTPDIPGIWAEYSPRTNLIWLLFLLKNLLKNRQPEQSLRQSPPSQRQTPRKPLAPCSPNPRQASHKHPKEGGNPHAAEKSIRPTGINSEALLQVSLFKKVLEERLVSVLELLDLEHGHEEMCCAADLVAYAIDEGWLDEKDFSD